MGISSALSATGAVPVGVVNPFAGATAPAGWLMCFGQAVSRTQYPILFSTLSTTYGVGDGSTTFNIPDMRGRAVAGKDDMGGTAASRITNAVAGITATTLGASGGNQTMHGHSHANTAAFTGTAGTTGGINSNHNHSYNEPYNTSGAGPAGSYGFYFYSRGAVTGTVSSDTTHNFTPSGTVAMTNATFPTSGAGTSQNIQPTLILNYIIKAQ